MDGSNDHEVDEQPLTSYFMSVNKTFKKILQRYWQTTFAPCHFQINGLSKNCFQCPN